MDRREFLKISTLSAIWFSVNSNPIIKSVFDEAVKNPIKKVLLFKIKEISSGNWIISGTMFDDIEKTKLRRKKWDFESFEILRIVEDEEATEIRNLLWKEIIGTPPPNLHLMTHSAQKLGFELKEKGVFGTPGCKAVSSLLESGYLQSEKNRSIYKEIGKKQGKINLESGHMLKMKKNLFESGYWGSDEQRGYSKISGKIGGSKQGKINSENGHMKEIQKIGATLGGKAMAERFKKKREERLNFLHSNLPSGTFTMKEVIDLAKKLEIPSALSVAYGMRDEGYLIEVHKGKNGSNTDFTLYCKA